MRCVDSSDLDALDYARRHGYDFVVDYESHTDRSVVYWKYNMAERLIKTGKYDWIWWLDFDTLVTNTNMKLTDIIEEELKNVTDSDAIWLLPCPRSREVT